MRSDWLAQYLVRHAEPLNHAYRLARQGDPVRFAATVSQFIRESLDPLLARLDHWAPEHKSALAETAYHSGLTMARHGWLTGDHRAVTDLLFLQVLPDWLSPHPEAAPRMMIQLLNALTHLPETSQRARLLAHWQSYLPKPDVTPDTLLVLGWMSGLPQFREAALEALRRHAALSTALAIGDPELFRHPWWQGPERGWYTRHVELGASVWLGGDFTSRPRLVVSAGHTLVQAGADCWRLHADAFGQVLLPCARPQVTSQPLPDGVEVPDHLRLNWRDVDQPRQCLERPHDWVVSFHTRYAVLVIPKVGDSR